MIAHEHDVGAFVLEEAGLEPVVGHALGEDAGDAAARRLRPDRLRAVLDAAQRPLVVGVRKLGDMDLPRLRRGQRAEHLLGQRLNRLHRAELHLVEALGVGDHRIGGGLGDAVALRRFRRRRPARRLREAFGRAVLPIGAAIIRRGAQAGRIDPVLRRQGPASLRRRGGRAVERRPQPLRDAFQKRRNAPQGSLGKAGFRRCRRLPLRSLGHLRAALARRDPLHPQRCVVARCAHQIRAGAREVPGRKPHLGSVDQLRQKFQMRAILGADGFPARVAVGTPERHQIAGAHAPPRNLVERLGPDIVENLRGDGKDRGPATAQFGLKAARGQRRLDCL